ncbi:hypothetical protein ACFL2C_01470 [Patescibacteria group bacterium]
MEKDIPGKVDIIRSALRIAGFDRVDELGDADVLRSFDNYPEVLAGPVISAINDSFPAHGQGMVPQTEVVELWQDATGINHELNQKVSLQLKKLREDLTAMFVSESS